MYKITELELNQTIRVVVYKCVLATTTICVFNGGKKKREST